MPSLAAASTPRRLQPKERLALERLLNAAFDTPTRLKTLLMELNREFNTYAGLNDTLPEVIGRLVAAANAQYWWPELLREARNAVPADPALLAFAERFDLAPVASAGDKRTGGTRLDALQLELYIRKGQPTVDIAVWRQRLGEIEGKVCRIEYPPGEAVGTGFLVAADLVLTNHHVVAALLDEDVEPGPLTFRFDYKVLADGITVDAGTTYKLAAKDWAVDSSPPSALDEQIEPALDPAATELDYALLRTAGSPGDEFVGGHDSAGARATRGWIGLPPARADFGTQKALFIVQHPLGGPMKVSLDTDAVLGLNGNGTRLRYATNTEPGSSGSPCFDGDWRLVALHHAGDPAYHQFGKSAQFNQGVPIDAIRQLLKARGKLGLLGPQAADEVTP